jgi:Leucine-rich repeat (LRR) protein
MKLWVIHLFTLILIFQINRTKVRAQCADIHPVDLAALQALYTNTNGDSWSDTTGWNQIIGPTASCDLNNIHGVFFNGNRVQFLIMPNNNLSGAIPPELGNLEQLIQLDLPQNNLTENIPASLGNLSLLMRMDFFDNDISGQIPNSLGNLTNLEVLALNRNLLSGDIPRDLGDLTNLIWLLLNDNMLTGRIPNHLGNLSNLEILSIHTNNLTGGIPSRLRNLSSIRQLIMYSNNLSGNLPRFLGDLNTLEFLELGDNEFSNRIPPEIGNLNSLITLNLSQNSLRREIPPELGMLSSLENLLLQENRLFGQIPGELGDLTSLTTMRLDGNDLSGCFDSNLNSLCGISVFIDDPKFDASWADFCSTSVGECPSASMPVIELPTIEITESRLFKTTDEPMSAPALFQNHPNPFQYETAIPFYLPHTDFVEITFYDLDGRLLKKWNAQLEKGYYELPVQRHELPANGPITCRLVTGDQSFVKLLIIANGN